MELTTEIAISAPASIIWDILVDFKCYEEWNPFITEIEGQLAVGAQLRMRVVPPGTRGTYVDATVLAVEPHRELRWQGSFPGFLKGEHSMCIEQQEGGCRFSQTESFHGVLAPLFRRSLDTDTRRGFELMNRELQRRAEARAGDAVGAVAD